MSSRQGRRAYSGSRSAAAGYRSGYTGRSRSASAYYDAQRNGYYAAPQGGSRSQASRYGVQRNDRQAYAPRYSAQYYYGTEAPDLYAEPYPQPRERRRRVQEDDTYARNAALRNRQQAQHMNPALILFMLGTVAIMCICLIQYLGLQAQVTTATAEVASLESSYQDLKQSNDAALNEINSNINLDEIKYKAITDLGMTYANEDQVITYSNDDSDYVHQVTQLDK